MGMRLSDPIWFKRGRERERYEAELAAQRHDPGVFVYSQASVNAFQQASEDWWREQEEWLERKLTRMVET